MLKSRMLLLASVAAMVPARCGALEAVRDSVDDLPEDLKKEYVEQNGKFVLQVSGMKSMEDFNRLQTAHTKEKQDHSALKARIREHFGDEKFEDVRAKLDKIPELEAAATGKLDEDKLNAIVEGRVKTRLAPVERERDNLKNQLTEKDKTIGTFTEKERSRTIKDAVREAAVKAKLLPEAMDDALMLAERVFEVREDDGKVVVRDGVGFTPGVEPGVFLTDIQTKRPHWWGPSAGGGAGGQRGGPAAGSNPWSHAGWNLTEQGKILSSDRSRAEQLAKSAGHDSPIGARKPDAPAGR